MNKHYIKSVLKLLRMIFILIIYNSPVCDSHRTNSILSANTNTCTITLCDLKARYFTRELHGSTVHR